MRRLSGLLLALPLPPLGVYLVRGYGPAFLTVLVLFVVAQGVFWFMAAGPGVMLWAGAIALGVVLSLFARAQP